MNILLVCSAVLFGAASLLGWHLAWRWRREAVVSAQTVFEALRELEKAQSMCAEFRDLLKERSGQCEEFMRLAKEAQKLLADELARKGIRA